MFHKNKNTRGSVCATNLHLFEGPNRLEVSKNETMVVIMFCRRLFH